MGGDKKGRQVKGRKEGKNRKEKKIKLECNFKKARRERF